VLNLYPLSHGIVDTSPEGITIRQLVPARSEKTIKVYGGQNDYAMDEMGGNDSERMNITMSDDDRYGYE
jgi:hypothetical protein